MIGSVRRRPTPGEAAERDYIAMSESLADEARDAERHQRPLTAAALREKSRIARSAAIAEELDPEPVGLGAAE